MDALLSIVAMTEYDPSIWDNFHVPAPLDEETARDKILLECGELELLYSDPTLLKYMITNWAMTESHIWQKLADTLDLDYNPIYNLDVTYEETRTPNITKTRTPNLTEVKTPNITESDIPNKTETRTPNVTNTETPSDSTTESVAGFNTSTFENSRQSTRSGTITNVETGTETVTTTGNSAHMINGTETRKETGTDTEHETGSETLNVHRYGNQGVTMTQDMLIKEREVSQFSLYDYISRSFKNRFCLLVY